MSSVATVLALLAKRLDRIQATGPEVRTGADRAGIGVKTAVTAQRSLIAARRLYQFISAEMERLIVR